MKKDWNEIGFVGKKSNTLKVDNFFAKLKAIEIVWSSCNCYRTIQNFQLLQNSIRAGLLNMLWDFCRIKRRNYVWQSSLKYFEK